MTRRRIATLLLAIAAGSLLAWAALPRYRLYRAVEQIAADDGDVRSSGWRWFAIAEHAGEPRMIAHRGRIHQRLTTAGDAALLDGAETLHRAELWTWDDVPQALVVRTMALQAETSDRAAHEMALDMLRTAPLLHARMPVIHTTETLLVTGSPPVRESALEAACGWAGPQNGDALAALALDDDDDLARPLRLALAMSDRPAGILRGDMDVGRLRLLPRPLREAQLLALARSGRLDAAPEDARWKGIDPPMIAWLLRQSTSPDVDAQLKRERTLEDMQRAGNRTAKFALDALRPERDAEQARQVLRDPTASLARRALAAWRAPDAPGPPAGVVSSLLADLIADTDTPAAIPALLAERRLDAPAAGSLAETWIRSFDDDAKQAGALLAALTGTHAALLNDAYEREDVGAVRTLQRLALRALGKPVGHDDDDLDADDAEFAHRTLHTRGGRLDANAILCALAAGDATVLALLTTPAPTDPTDVRSRAWLIERFLPTWQASLGRPLAGDARVLQLHFDALEALRRLEARRIEFDREARVWRRHEGNRPRR